MAVQKTFIIKVFDQDGSTFIKSLTSDKPDDESLPYLKNTPEFPSYINGGLGECVLDLAYPFDDFDEGGVVDFMNIVQIYAVTSIYPLGTLIYTGFMSKYDPYIESGAEGVKVTCLGLGSIFPASFYEDGDLTVEHTGQDPETIGRAIIDHVNSIYGGNFFSYSDDTTDPVGTVVSVTFTDQTWSAALKKVVELAGAGWWWKIDEQGQYWLKAKPSTATHTFTIGKDIEKLHGEKDGEKVINEVYVRRSGDLETVYDDATSQAQFGTGSPPTGKRSKLVTDSGLTDVNAADQRGNKEIDDNKDPKVVSPFTVNMNYDLESIKVGDTCQIVNLRNGSDFFGTNMLIVGLTYRGDTVDIQLEDTTSSFSRELATFVQNNSIGGSFTSGSSSGGGGSTDFVDKEVPSGAINGSNTTFTLSQTPIVGSDHVFLNGVLQKEGTDYSISGATITMTTAPETGAKLVVDYRITSPVAFADKEVPTGSINGSNTGFTLAHTPVTGSDHVFLNGILQAEGADYTISGGNITFITAPEAGATLVVSYRY